MNSSWVWSNLTRHTASPSWRPSTVRPLGLLCVPVSVSVWALETNLTLIEWTVHYYHTHPSRYALIGGFLSVTLRVKCKSLNPHLTLLLNRASYYEISVDDGPWEKQKSSGLSICTGTGSKAWYTKLNTFFICMFFVVVFLHVCWCLPISGPGSPLWMLLLVHASLTKKKFSIRKTYDLTDSTAFSRMFVSWDSFWCVFTGLTILTNWLNRLWEKS